MNAHLRKEKNCLNCGREVSDRYCSHCGQENLVPKDTVAHLVQHFFADITHYDSKLLTTVFDLLFRPGLLTREYLLGKRIRYLNPVRMYFFISFVFFFILFAQKAKEEKLDRASPMTTSLNQAKQFLADSLRTAVEHRNAGSAIAKTRDSLLKNIAAALDTVVVPVQKDESIGFKLGSTGFRFTLVETRYNNLREYDSIQKTLSDSLRDDFIGRLFIRKSISLKKDKGGETEITVHEEFQHNVPKLMFVLLPLFALLLQLFYNKKKSTYAAHLIFSIHFHSFAFLLFIFANLLNLIFPYYTFSIATFCATLYLLIYYLILALKNVYSETIYIAFAKALAISMLYIALITISLLVWALIIFFST